MKDQKTKNANPGKDKHNKDQSGKNSLDKEKSTRRTEMDADTDPDTSPEKKIQVDDDPEGTKRKIPHI